MVENTNMVRQEVVSDFLVCLASMLALSPKFATYELCGSGQIILPGNDLGS